jgi:hypothetical protein
MVSVQDPGENGEFPNPKDLGQVAGFVAEPLFI